MDKYILTTSELLKEYSGFFAVDGVSLSIPENKVYGLLGPNGAGKSTILKMLSGIAHPTSGKITYEGRAWSRNDLNTISALIETPPLYGNLSAEDNLLVRAKALGIPKERIYEVLETVELTNTGSKKAKRFSLGMKQRLGIALALLNKPKLMILDEPANGLDPIGIASLRQLIRSFPEQGITTIVSSHILSEIEHTVDYIGIISNGKLGYEGELPQGGSLETLFKDVVSHTPARRGE